MALLALVACAVSLARAAAGDAGDAGSSFESGLGSSSSFFVWHITDVHVDPWYVLNADAASCYCETAAACPRMGANCGVLAPNATTAARAWRCGARRLKQRLDTRA